MSDAGEAPRNVSGAAAALGSLALSLYRAGRELYEIFVRTLYWTAKGTREPGVVARYCFEVGNKSLFFISVTMGFIGMIMVFQSALQAQRILGDLSQLGPTFIELLVRDLAATLAAMMLATRVGAGIAAEIGSMVVTEQVDALRMSGVDPVDHLIVPRFLASLVMSVALILWAGLVSTFAGLATAHYMFDVPVRTFLDFRLVDAGDLTTGLAKSVAYGAAIPVVSGYCGLSTHGGSEGVGWATTRAVVNSSLAVIILDLLLSTAGFLLFPPA